MSVPAPALAQYQQSLRLQALAARRAMRAWDLVEAAAISESWEAIKADPALTAAVVAYQVRNAQGGASYGAQTLAAQGLKDPVEAFVNPAAFGGFTGAGMPLEAMFAGAAPYTKRLIGGGMGVRDALAAGRKFVGMSTMTAVGDAGRAAAGVDTFTRAKTGYVRMLTPPSCSRCVPLAGKFYRHNEGFLRHPRCNCIHIPTTENVAQDVTTDPYAYFESLPEAEQDRTFTKAGAQAIRDGGDIFQVVNSRRGMSANGLTTTEGMSRRGNARSQLGKQPRWTPEGIYAQKLPREQTLRLLEKHGYVLKGGQDPLGVLKPSQANYKTATTEAQKRMERARLDWESVLAGRHPRGSKGHKLTPDVVAHYEDQYRYWVARRGQIFTG